VAVLATAAGFYFWFRAQVSEANERVTEEIRVALTDTPSSTITSLVESAEAPESP
jgi:hypothetical protein